MGAWPTHIGCACAAGGAAKNWFWASTMPFAPEPSAAANNEIASRLSAQ
jgi:hypothetical protein